ncbi:alpha/beta fold hydrolase [Sphingomonas jeddahensis]|uniref:Soluble epoxide hydrolase n=1 Tax=Sphingomonas jeddahensis TaxID=1915074 RepID=A0A1V2EWR6_9SPHN|nr:alpha/beta hydrolase [Sphingomonas jeddahensis]ONF97121.1 Soluble epoxide hydrolase [Sphingomonas jeddahensis]
MKQRHVETSTIKMNVVDEGHGPAILLCHGFPETSYAWRHQIEALAKAGFRAIAPDMRGYGGSEQPRAVDEYSVFHVVGDMIALLDVLGEQHAVIVGNDWGATIAWQAAQMRPDRFRGVVALSVPIMGRPPVPPTRIFPRSDDAELYTLYFQEPGVAEAELERDTRRTLRKLLFAASGDAGPRQPGDATPNPFGMVSRDDGLLAPLPDPKELPAWLSEADLDVYADAFTRAGFRGGLNYYRNLDRNWQLQAALAGIKVELPALFIAGERDTGLQIPGMSEIIKAVPTLAPRIRAPLIIEGAGHWVAQERPDSVSAAIIEFAVTTFAAM